VLEEVVKKGLQYCDDIEVYYAKSTIHSVTGKHNALNAESTVDQGIGIRVQVDGKIGSAFTTGSDYTECIRKAASIARCKKDRASLEFPCGDIPSVKGLYSRETAHLSIEDIITYLNDLVSSDIPTEGIVELREMERAVYNSSGLEVSEKGTFADLSLTVQGKCTVFDERSSRTFQGLEGDMLLEDLIERAGKCAAGKIADISEIILSPEASSLLFSTLLCPALCADNMIQNQSFLRGHEGKRVASEELTVKDDATLAGGLVSRSFDAEGTPSRCVPLVEGGRLTGFLHDLTTAQLSKKKSTGNAFRDYRNEPIVFPSNVVIEYEDSIPLNRLIEETDRGVMARGIIGAYSSDYISGDFSVTLDECSLIENGDVKRIENLSIGGNIFEFLTSIECVSKEIVQSGHFVIPWIKISKE
jgi:PmbA protein